ncbi:MAG: GlcG/HbpS family heme-binding protein [Ostreibacterium sp.]
MLSGINACVKMAREKGWAMSVVIVDRGDHIVASYTGAQLKASTALSWSMPTNKIEQYVSDKPQFRHFPELLTIEGGEPVNSASKYLVGGVGVAGSSANNDGMCAKAAAKTIMDQMVKK